MRRFILGFGIGVVTGYLAVLMAVLYEFSEGPEISAEWQPGTPKSWTGA